VEPALRKGKARISPKYAERQARIIDVATRMINRRGVSGMTLAQVADEMAMNPTAIAYYFKTKDDLATAAFLAGLARLSGIVGQDPQGSATDRITGLIDRYFSYVGRAALGSEPELISPNDIRAFNAPPVLTAYVDVFRSIRAVAFDHPVAPVHHQMANARTHLLLAQLHWFRAWCINIHPRDHARAGQRVGSILLEGIARSKVGLDRQWFSDPIQPPEAGEGKARDCFLQAATELINEQGYHGASVERISARVSVSKGSFYHHLQTKDELIIACFDRTIDILATAIADVEARASSGLHALALLAATLVHRQLSGEATLLRLSAATTLPEALQPLVMMDYSRIALRIASIFSDGIADGSIRPLDAYVAAEMFLGMINASDELRHFLRDLTFDAAIRDYVEPLFLGINRVT
jgi:AcrR family transcriptional regulator